MKGKKEIIIIKEVSSYRESILPYYKPILLLNFFANNSLCWKFLPLYHNLLFGCLKFCAFFAGVYKTYPLYEVTFLALRNSENSRNFKNSGFSNPLTATWVL